MGSHFNSRKAGVRSSNFCLPVIILAAKFWRSCIFLMLLSEVLDQITEQLQ